MSGAGARLGSTLRHSKSGARLIVWSQGPTPGTYWCHAIDERPEDERAPTVLVRVTNSRREPLPVVSLEGEDL